MIKTVQNAETGSVATVAAGTTSKPNTIKKVNKTGANAVAKTEPVKAKTGTEPAKANTQQAGATKKVINSQFFSGADIDNNLAGLLQKFLG